MTIGGSDRMTERWESLPGMLLGLAAKNSILLVEYAIEREREGMSQH